MKPLTNEQVLLDKEGVNILKKSHNEMRNDLTIMYGVCIIIMWVLMATSETYIMFKTIVSGLTLFIIGICINLAIKSLDRSMDDVMDYDKLLDEYYAKQEESAING